MQNSVYERLFDCDDCFENDTNGEVRTPPKTASRLSRIERLLARTQSIRARIPVLFYCLHAASRYEAKNKYRLVALVH